MFFSSLPRRRVENILCNLMLRLICFYTLLCRWVGNIFFNLMHYCLMSFYQLLCRRVANLVWRLILTFRKALNRVLPGFLIVILNFMNLECVVVYLRFLIMWRCLHIKSFGIERNLGKIIPLSFYLVSHRQICIVTAFINAF